MGKGDKKSKRGKIIIGSFGVRRRKKNVKRVGEPSPKEMVKTVVTTAAAPAPEVPPTKPAKTARPGAAEKTTVKPAAKKTEEKTVTTVKKTTEKAAEKAPRKTVAKAAGRSTEKTAEKAPGNASEIDTKPAAKAKKPAAKKEEQ